MGRVSAREARQYKLGEEVSGRRALQLVWPGEIPAWHRPRTYRGLDACGACDGHGWILTLEVEQPGQRNRRVGENPARGATGLATVASSRASVRPWRRRILRKRSKILRKRRQSGRLVSWAQQRQANHGALDGPWPTRSSRRMEASCMTKTRLLNGFIRRVIQRLS